MLSTPNLVQLHDNKLHTINCPNWNESPNNTTLTQVGSPRHGFSYEGPAPTQGNVPQTWVE